MDRPQQLVHQSETNYWILPTNIFKVILEINFSHNSDQLISGKGTFLGCYPKLFFDKQ